jgi:hypothetical protein
MIFFRSAAACNCRGIGYALLMWSRFIQFLSVLRGTL